jgi:ATPase family AAA domain-containing protein 3A/B
VLAVGSLVASGFVAREAAKLGRQRLAAILGRPSLVRETSRLSALRPVSAARQLVQRLRPPLLHAVFDDVVLHPQLQQRVLSVAAATKNTQRNKAPFRNVCFYGPPGTGKTLVARKLAHFSGLDYAIMSTRGLCYHYARPFSAPVSKDRARLNDSAAA